MSASIQPMSVFASGSTKPVSTKRFTSRSNSRITQASGSAPRQLHQSEPMLGRQRYAAMPNPALTFGAAQGVQVEHGLPIGPIGAVGGKGRPPPYAAQMGGIGPEIIDERAALTDEGDARLRTENAPQRLAVGIERASRSLASVASFCAVTQATASAPSMSSSHR